MSNAFSYGVTALDEALLTEPVFVSERGLANRRAKLERAFKKALLAYLEDRGKSGDAIDVITINIMIEEIDNEL